MKIMVTGGAGFIGSHLVDKLVDTGHDVVVVDNLYTGKKENINSKALFYKKDIRDKDIKEIFARENIDAVFHLAAQMDIRKSVDDPLFDADVNIMGGVNILENCAKSNVKKFIFASSGGVMYGECGNRKPKEDEFPNPISPYGDSKLALEFYLNFYQYNYNIKCSALRYGNVYGPRQDPHGEAGVVAIFSGAMLNDAEVRIFGDGEQLRDYIYVGDVVDANIAAFNKGEGKYNIGTGESKSVNELFDILSSKTGYDKKPVYNDEREGELKISRMSVEKAKKELDWKPKVNFKEGLKKTVEYFKTKN